MDPAVKPREDEKSCGMTRELRDDEKWLFSLQTDF